MPMSISFTNGPSKPSTSNPAKSHEKKTSPQIDFQKKRLERQKKQIDDKLKKLSICAYLRDLAFKLAIDQELYAPLRPILNKMGIKSNVIQDIELYGEVAQKDMRLFCILLRRQADIDWDTIVRLRMNGADYYKSMIWDSKGIHLYIYGPYKAPEEEPGTIKPGI
jgi:hypothetical protein